MILDLKKKISTFVKTIIIFEIKKMFKKETFDFPSLEETGVLRKINARGCFESLVLQRVSKKQCMWKCAILTNKCSTFSTAFYTIFNMFNITKLALEYRLFHQICFCHSQDMFE